MTTPGFSPLTLASTPCFHPPLPLLSAAFMKPPRYPTGPTRSTQRRSQRTRERMTVPARKDYEECPWCHKLFSVYRSSYTRHVRPCKVKYEAQVQEAARAQAERIETPTPEPYTPLFSDIETDNEDIGIGV